MFIVLFRIHLSYHMSGGARTRHWIRHWIRLVVITLYVVDTHVNKNLSLY